MKVVELLLRGHAPEIGDRVKVDFHAEVRRVGEELGKSEDEIQAAIKEADLILAEQRRRARRML